MSCAITIGSHLAILSFRRSGSMVIARNLGIALGSVENPVKVHPVKNPDYCFDTGLSVDVIHCHLLTNFPTGFTIPLQYCKIFSIRLDIIECILSSVLSSHYNSYHWQLDQYKPFTFKNFAMLDELCNQYIIWHTKAETLLNKDSYVVQYEQLMKCMSTGVGSVQLVYKNKDKLLLNRDQVVDVINKHLPKMEASMTKLTQHVNPADIYKFFKHNPQW